MHFKKNLTVVAGAIFVASIASSANADSLVHGFYNAATNTGFTVNTLADGTELAVGTNIRFCCQVLPFSANNYQVPLGVGGAPPAAKWDFEYSVDFSTGGGTLSAANTTALLSIFNTANGQTVSFDPESIFDNNTTKSGNNGYQNAENLSFAFLLSPTFAFDPNATDKYVVTLTLSGAAGVLGSVSENIFAGTPTPLPGALPLFVSGLGMFGFGAYRRRKAQPKTA